MRLLAPLLLFATLGCDAVVTGADFGAIETGICRQPSACYTAASCACDDQRDSVVGCLACDPTGNPAGCDCRQFPGSACIEAAQVCVGRGQLCDGVCVPSGSSCDSSNGTPAQFVVSADGDAGATTHERRCAFVHDVCCPAAPDAGVDLSVPD